MIWYSVSRYQVLYSPYLTSKSPTHWNVGMCDLGLADFPRWSHTYYYYPHRHNGNSFPLQGHPIAGQQPFSHSPSLLFGRQVGRLLLWPSSTASQRSNGEPPWPRQDQQSFDLSRVNLMLNLPGWPDHPARPNAQFPPIRLSEGPLDSTVWWTETGPWSHPVSFKLNCH